eukprot:353445-Chlamydomonas_euryale.AAC.18
MGFQEYVLEAASDRDSVGYGVDIPGSAATEAVIQSTCARIFARMPSSICALRMGVKGRNGKYAARKGGLANKALRTEKVVLACVKMSLMPFCHDPESHADDIATFDHQDVRCPRLSLVHLFGGNTSQSGRGWLARLVTYAVHSASENATMCVLKDAPVFASSPCPRSPQKKHQLDSRLRRAFVVLQTNPNSASSIRIGYVMRDIKL